MNRVRVAALGLVIPIILGLSVANAAGLQLSGSQPTTVVITRCADAASVTMSAPTDGWIDLEIRTAPGCANLPFLVLPLDTSGQMLSTYGPLSEGSPTPIPVTLDSEGSVTASVSDAVSSLILTLDTWPIAASVQWAAPAPVDPIG